MEKTQLQIDAKAAADLIRDPARWTSGASAVDAEGKPVSARSTRACAWCAYGAVERVCTGGRADRLSMALERCFPGQDYAWDVNDGPDGHRRILEALDAIAEGA